MHNGQDRLNKIRRRVDKRHSPGTLFPWGEDIGRGRGGLPGRYRRCKSRFGPNDVDNADELKTNTSTGSKRADDVR